MNYFSRQREDGKFDILEGSPDEPGRIVTTHDTLEEAAAYIAEQSAIFDELFDRITDIELDELDIPAEEVTAAGEEDTVPYKLMNKDGKTCVVKKSDGSVVKCHDDKEKAVAHLKALYVNKADASVQAAIEELDGKAITPEQIEKAAEFVINAAAGNWGGNNSVSDNTVATGSTNYGITITTPADPTETAAKVSDMLAHAAPPAPPASFFTDPQFTKLERYVTITADGRFYTHIAGWNECHVGYGDMCVKAPKEADYSHFSVGTVLTSDGTTVPTGVIAITGGHADIGMDANSARSKYDDPSTGKVDVALGTDEFGIWASGAMRPTATAEDVHTLRASGVSGDWRLIDGQLRLIGICAVNVPGFPKLAVAASADGITALVAAGGPPEPHPDFCDCKDMTSEIIEELDNLQRIVADAGLEDVIIEKLAARIPSNDADLEELFQRIS